MRLKEATKSYLQRIGIRFSDQGKNIERDEESVEEMVCEDLIEVVNLQAKDVVQVVKVIQVVRDKIL